MYSKRQEKAKCQGSWRQTIINIHEISYEILYPEFWMRMWISNKYLFTFWMGNFRFDISKQNMDTHQSFSKYWNLISLCNALLQTQIALLFVGSKDDRVLSVVIYLCARSRAEWVVDGDWKTDTPEWKKRWKDGKSVSFLTQNRICSCQSEWNEISFSDFLYESRSFNSWAVHWFSACQDFALQFHSFVWVIKQM